MTLIGENVQSVEEQSRTKKTIARHAVQEWLSHRKVRDDYERKRNDVGRTII